MRLPVDRLDGEQSFDLRSQPAHLLCGSPLVYSPSDQLMCL
jgi:hypothetical protein